MVCVKCKGDIPDGSPFCNLCGKKQPAEGRKRNPKRRGNGQGTVFKRGTTWTALVVLYYYTDEKGKRRPKTASKGGFRTKADAINHLPSLRIPVMEAEKKCMDDYWQVWSKVSLPKLSLSKQDAYHIAYKKLESIAFRPIVTLGISELQSVVDAKAPTYYPAKDMKTVLNHLYKMAAAENVVRSNIAQYITLPTLDETVGSPFSAEDQKKLWLLYEAGNAFVPYILLMIYTGMMPGELLAARKDMIDWDAKTIVGGGKKTKKRKVTPIVLADIIIPVLQRICDGVDGDKLIRINKDNFYTAYYDTLEKAGCEHLPPYSCRHTTGTALGTADIPISIVKEIMRHTKLSSTERYVHVDPTTMLEAVNKINVNNSVNNE